MKRIFDDESTSTLWKSFYKQNLNSFENKTSTKILKKMTVHK